MIFSKDMKNFRVMPLYSLMLALLICAGSVFSAQAAPLPDALGEWIATPAAVTLFETASGDFGQWENRVYIRSAPPAGIEANLMEGSGPGTLWVPGGSVSGDAPGFAAYRTLNISGKSAILERGEVTGQALAIAFGTNRTLTLETKSVSEEELINFATRLTVALEAK
jgi:hypothetical protein